MERKLYFFFKCVSFLLSETRKDMVAIKFKPPVQGAANLKGGGMWGKWCDGVCLLLWWRGGHDLARLHFQN